MKLVQLQHAAFHMQIADVCVLHADVCFFYKEDFIENHQKRRLTKTIYRDIYKIDIQSTTNFKIQTIYIIKKLL